MKWIYEEVSKKVIHVHNYIQEVTIDATCELTDIIIVERNKIFIK